MHARSPEAAWPWVKSQDPIRKPMLTFPDQSGLFWASSRLPQGVGLSWHTSLFPQSTLPTACPGCSLGLVVLATSQIGVYTPPPPEIRVHPLPISMG